MSTEQSRVPTLAKVLAPRRDLGDQRRRGIIYLHPASSNRIGRRVPDTQKHTHTETHSGSEGVTGKGFINRITCSNATASPANSRFGCTKTRAPLLSRSARQLGVRPVMYSNMATSSRRAAACWDLPAKLALLMLLAALLLLLTPAPAFGGRTYDNVAGGVDSVIAVEDGSGLQGPSDARFDDDGDSGVGYTDTVEFSAASAITHRKLKQTKLTNDVKVETARVKYNRKATLQIGGGGK
ncbi:hypothetical protein VOLCADRAFT_104616 [Volvox carteri f. nagariensis]|uniref:Uncharacterized protein n=1 Tax=Volvox carteri f. nagariensis TaxID=3068 RepID=D8TUX0_VOLCA|nr:uncharacterized protein VOLCADRAFT_104616 [Volvox carteri f. nagariensis]EFJ48785.1 hypothetical protein VOLCADRAFT_104616 [Volvox carteri f. nagariensis]|eukprot:XP_002950117.1 hypothetical protein VOLCADRAFT_104616 [Volvox carteri f. nagariensis]